MVSTLSVDPSLRYGLPTVDVVLCVVWAGGMYVDCDQTYHGHVLYSSLLLWEGWTIVFKAGDWYPILMTIPVFYSSHEPCLWRSRIYEPPESQVIVRP